MRHCARPDGGLWLIYTYNLEVGPRAWRWLLVTLVTRVFGYETHKRFARLCRFLQHHAAEIGAWQAREGE